MYRHPITLFLRCALIILYGDTRARIGLPPGLDKGPDEKYMHILKASLANAFLYMHLAASSLGLAAKWWTQGEIPGAVTDGPWDDWSAASLNTRLYLSNISLALSR